MMYFPSEYEFPMTSSKIIGVIAMSIIGLLLLAGLIVQNTSLFTTRRSENENPDKALVESKNIIG